MIWFEQMDRVKQYISYPVYIEKIKNDVTIAVLDSGVCRHPDLKKQVICFKDFIHGRTTLYDDNGHGTHVCGILAGSGRASKGKYSGIARNAKILMGKVLDEHGDGSCETMLRGLDWVYAVHKEYHIRILNISVGIGGLSDIVKESALQERIEKLWDEGIIVVCAAGNKGPGNGSISSVGGSNKVITVGCVDVPTTDSSGGPCNRFSGRGVLGGKIRKPDVVAPGTEIVSCNHKFFRVDGKIRNGYTAKSGTSMATPIVSGGLALLLAENDFLTNEECKEKLLMTANDLGLPWNQQGWGIINIEKLITS